MSTLRFNNAFDAVTGNKEEVCKLQVRADLMIVLREFVEEKGWKQADTAKVFKLEQSRVSDLLQGKIDKFSIDLLMTCLHRAGFRFKSVYKNGRLSMEVQVV